MNSEQPATHHSHSRVAFIFGLLLSMLFAAWLAANRNSLLADPDTAWHIVVGRDIWNSSSLPVVDTYSHTFSGQPWIAKEWLAQIVLYGADAAAGWNGVAALAVVAIITLGVSVYACAVHYLKPHVAIVVTIIAMGAARSTFLARPHLIAMPISVLWSCTLFKDADSGRPPRFWLLGLLILWTNLHSSFTLGWVIAGLAFLHYCEKTRGRDKTGLLRWIIFLVLCPAAALIHPYGYKAALMTYAVAGANEATPLLEEWLPFNATTHIAALAALLILLGTSLATGVRLTLSKTALVVGLLYLFLAHGRFAGLLFTIAPVIMAGELAQALPATSAVKWKNQALDFGEAAIAARYSVLIVTLSSALLAIVISLVTVLPSQRQPDLAISGAMKFAKDKQLSGPVMNFYNFGGALIQNDIKTYIDGRSDQLFQSGFFLNDQKTMQHDGTAAFHATLARHRITWTIFPPGDPRNNALARSSDWKRVYEDQTAIIHVKRGTNDN